MATQNGTLYRPSRWQLTALFAAFDDPALAAAQEALTAAVATFAAERAELAPDMDPALFAEYLQGYETIQRQFVRLFSFSNLKVSEDTQDQTALAFQARIRQQAADLFNQMLFFPLWVQKLEDEAAERLFAAAGPNRRWLEETRQQRPYSLTEAEEKIVNQKNVTGRQALVTLYGTITDRYQFEMSIDGEVQQLTRGQLSVHTTGSDPARREAAYKALFARYEPDAPVLGQIYQAVARDWHSEFVKLRGHASPLSVRNVANDVPDEAVTALLNVAEANAGLFQRYFRLKAGWLGVEQLRRYDLGAPVSDSDVEIDFDEAVHLVFDSFNEFDPQMAQMAMRVLDDGHYDAEVRPTKRTGAFCASVAPGMTPYVLQSYTGRPRDVATMAHELGHAVHSLLAGGHTALTFRSSLPLAETASTFSEMLLVDRLLSQTDDPAVQRELLARQMDDNYATIGRQAFFALFERDAHAAIQEGAAVDALSDLYFENLQRQFGAAVDLSADFRNEWVAVPHFYRTPFYVYAYAFGQLLVLALYRRYQEEGAAFKPQYREILAAGGSAAPEAILQRAGIDMRSEAFWQGGFDVLATRLQQLSLLA